GALDLNAAITSAVSLSVSGVSDLGANVTTTGNSQTYSGAVTLSADTTLTDAGNILFSSTVDGAYTLTVSNSGADLTFTGAVGGTIPLTGLTITTRVLTAADIKSTGTLSVTNSGASSITGVIENGSTALALTKAGAGTLTLSGTNTYTGVTTINAGTLSVATIGNGGVASGNLGSATNAASNLVLGGGTLQYTGSTASTDRSFTITDSTTGTFDITANDLTISGAAASTSGALTKTGSGRLILTGSNAYTGLTTISAGALRAGHNNALGTTAGGVTVSATGAALELYNNITIGDEALTLNGTGISSGGALRNISGDNTYGGLITLASASRINSDTGTLTLNKSTDAITGTNVNLTIGGSG
ncbi:MAG: hypothetical protein EBZ71_05060, partial [Proteobacteria bacterium]|nr:hypothetical protein [Pseudomonadota bacterium]